MGNRTRLGHLSGLEDGIALGLRSANIPYTYEEHTLQYEQPAKVRRYKPDFILPNAIIIEGKGRFMTADRQKHQLIAKQFPELDIRFVFSNPNSKINKRSKTTYGMWCRKNQFEFSKGTVPQAWFEEPARPDTVKATMELLNWKPPKGVSIE